MLEKIKYFSKKFGKFSAEDIDKLGFFPIPNNDLLKKPITKGHWGILFFSNYEEFNIYSGIRIMPDESSENWPVYQLNHLNNAFFQAPTIPSYIIYNHYFLLRKYRTNGVKYKDNWAEYYKIMLPVYQYFGGEDNLEGLKKIVFDEKNWPKANLPMLPDEEYIDFMIHHSKDKKGAKYLYDLIEKLNEDEDYLPAVPPTGLGIWEQRIWNAIGMRAYSKAFDEPNNKIEPLLFGCFNQPHGYDAEEMDVNIKPNQSCSSASMIWDIVNTNITLQDEEHLDKIINAPEYRCALAILEQGQGGYTGLENIEAAAILDSEMNEPMRAWNCLLSAGYWAGMNKPELQETIMEAAIYLCKKHKWTEAADAVQYNLDIYKSA